MGYMGTDFTTEEYVKEMQNAYSSPWFTPTPSGSNFGDTVTGQQDIYHDPGEMRPYTDPGERDMYRDPGEMRPYPDPGERDMYRDPGERPYAGPVTSAQEPYFIVGGSSSPGNAPQKTEDSAWNRLAPLRGGSSGGGMTFGQARTTVTTPTRPRGPMPVAGEMPTFTAPTRDQERIKELTQQKSAAGLRAMRAQIQKAMGQGYRNPNVKRMTLRDALAGYGQGIENVMTGAQTAAGQEYNTEYASAYDTAGKNWQTAYQTKMQDWQNKVNDYFKQYGTVTSTA